MNSNKTVRNVVLINFTIITTIFAIVNTFEIAENTLMLVDIKTPPLKMNRKSYMVDLGK